MIKIYFENRQKKIKLSSEIKAQIKKVCKLILDEEKIKGAAEIGITFVDNDGIRELNSEYRNKDNVTDVLSFPLSEDGINFDINEETGAKLLGDIVISLERAQEQSEMYNHSFTREICFLTAHSMYHLLGYDHEDGATVPQEKSGNVMFEKQEMILNKLGITRELKE